MPDNNATPPKGHDWGERTLQAKPHQTEPQYYRSDAEELRHRHGIGRLDLDEFEGIQSCYPDLLIHERSPERTESARATNFLAKGAKGSGKSTLMAFFAIRLMDENDEKVIWPGSPERSEWLRLRDYATVWLPENASIDATWMSEESDQPASSVDELEGIARHVKRYSGPRDLNQQLAEWQGGTFHVVYPDPSFTGCREIFDASDRITGVPPVTPGSKASEDRPETPMKYWWFAWLTSRVEDGPFEWWTWMYDELHHLVPENAKQDDHRSYDLVLLFQSVFDDSRRALLSIFGTTHREGKLSHLVRKEFDWRIHMPDGTPNPHMRRTSTLPAGFQRVPMGKDIMSKESVGVGLCYTQSERTWFRWDEVTFNDEDENRWLRLRLEESASGSVSGPAEDGRREVTAGD